MGERMSDGRPERAPPEEKLKPTASASLASPLRRSGKAQSILDNFTTVFNTAPRRTHAEAAVTEGREGGRDGCRV